MKFKNQNQDPVNRNNFIYAVFDKNVVRRHKHFKFFFTLVDPRCPVPPKKQQPNYKVDEFFSHFNEVSLAAYDPGENLSTDKQNQRFTGIGEGTIHYKFKREGVVISLTQFVSVDIHSHFIHVINLLLRSGGREAIHQCTPKYCSYWSN